MRCVNPEVIRNIGYYKTRLDSNISGIWGYLHNMSNSVDLYQTSNFKLYSLVSENIRMDLNYLPTIDMQYNLFGFVGMQRNIRNSIEVFYDLYNLTYDSNYESALRCASEYVGANKADDINIQNIERDYQLKMKRSAKGKTMLTIKQKAKIARQNRLPEEIYKKLKRFSMEANAFVHPDIFYVDKMDPSIRLRELLEIDTILLAHSYKLLVDRINSRYETEFSFDPYIEYNQLWSALGGFNVCFIV